MTDPILEHGLGGKPSPVDERDWPIDALYALTGKDAVVLPASWIIPPPYPPPVDQGTSPMCVAYSAAGEQGYFDLRDQGTFNYDEPRFFYDIGGDANGAVIRDAFAYRLASGYPIHTSGQASLHRIAAYYAVPVTRADLCQAILAFGPLILGTPWYWSWFHPIGGVLPAPTTVAGGHAIEAVGWDARGLRLRNSWGTGWGIGGDAFLPWAYLSRVREAWKALDRIEPAPPATTYTLHIAPGAKVWTAVFTGSCISGWKTQTWGPTASTAPCHAPVVRKGCVSGQATVAYVSKGTFYGKWVRIGTGVTVTHS